MKFMSRLIPALCHMFLAAHWAEATDYAVLGVANGAGHKTELSIVNRSVRTAQVTLKFIGSEGIAGEPAEKLIAPMQTLLLGNAMEELWGVAGQQGVVSISSESLLLITAMKYQEREDGGRAGTALPVIAAEDYLAPAAFGDLLWVVEDGIQSSRVLVYLEKPGTEAEIVVFDAAGVQVGSRAISGAPLYFEIPVASMVSEEALTSGKLKVARAELRVKKGRGTAGLEVLDSASGEVSSSAASPNVLEDILSLPIAFHKTSLGNATLQTDMRIFNPGSATARITGRLGTVLKSFELEAKAMVEYKELLSSLFGVTESAQGIVTFASTQALVAQARNVATSSVGESSIEHAEIHAAPRAEPTLHQGWSTAIGGLRGSSAHLMLQTRTVGTTGAMNLTLRNAAGEPIGTARIELGLREQRFEPMGEVFPGVEIPDNAYLQIDAIAGSVGAVVISIDKVSQDIEYLAAEGLPASEARCLAPDFLNISVSNRNLSEPGSVTFGWSAAKADSVELIPGSAGPAASSQTVSVTESTRFLLIARNACGESTKAIYISVGRPALKSVAYQFASDPAHPSSEGGQPGQFFVLEPENLGDTSALSKLLLRDTAGQIEMELPIAGFDPTGLPYARVPLLADATAAAGYRTGEFRLSGLVDDVETTAIAFHILPLSPTEDPVAAFLSLLDRMRSASEAAVAGLPAAARPAVNAMRSGSVRIEAELRKVASDIAASGSARLSYGSWNTSPPASAAAATITRADLDVLMAYNARYLAESGMTTVLQQKAASGAPQATGTCIGDKEPYIPFCKALEGAVDALFPLTGSLPPIFNIPALDDALTRGRDALRDHIVDRLKNSGLNALVMKANILLNWNNLLCSLQPIRLDEFQVTPTKYQVNKYLGSTELRAILVPKHKDAKELVDALIKIQTDKILSQLPQQHANLKPALEPLVKSAVRLFFGEFESQITEWLRQHLPGVKPSQNLQVGKCDIEQFYPKTFGPDESKAPAKTDPLIPIYVDHVDRGRDNYFFQGNATGDDTMCVRPDPKKFLFSSGQLANFELHPERRKQVCQFTAMVSAGAKDPARFARSFARATQPTVVPEYGVPISVGGRPEFIVTGYDLNAWCIGCVDASGGEGILQVGILGKRHEVGSPLVDNFRYQNSNAAINAYRADKDLVTVVAGSRTTYIPAASPTSRPHFHDALAKVGISFSIPPNRYGTQTIGVSIEMQPGCQRPSTYVGAVFGDNNTFQQFSGTNETYKKLFIRASRGLINITVGGELAKFPQVTGSCIMKVDVGFFNTPPEE